MNVIDLKNYMQRLCNEGKAEFEVKLVMDVVLKASNCTVDNFEILAQETQSDDIVQERYIKNQVEGFSGASWEKDPAPCTIEDLLPPATSAETPPGSPDQSPPVDPGAQVSPDPPQTSQRSGKLPEDLPPG